ncbi:MAG: hypothetical protein K1W35_12430 [Lachnospiraceae bacterium]
MTYEEVKNIVESGTDNIVCKQFIVLPNQIAAYIESMVYGNYDYGYVCIGIVKDKTRCRFIGIDRYINMDNIIQSALKQVKADTKISYEICEVECKRVCIIKVKTCARMIPIASSDIVKMNEILKQLLSACVKLQANAIYYNATEDQRNDYIRDILDTAGYDVKDQTRRGLSPSGKAAGEVDILIKEHGFPVTIIEALNLNSLNKAYLDKHIDKIYNYDTAGNKFNIILSYVTASNFIDFCDKYFEHIKKHKYPFAIQVSEDNVVIEECSFSDIKVMKTVHNRNRCETVLYHVCIWIK